MNRNIYKSQYSVPSLSLASSRSKKTIPTKDVNVQQFKPFESRSKAQINDRMSRPPIFSSKIIRQQKISIESEAHQQLHSNKISTVAQGSLSRNVYLHRQDPVQNVTTFRAQKTIVQTNNQQANNLMKSSSSSLLRNPQSAQRVAKQIQQRLQQRKVDVNKSLFERRIAKLFQQADFYDKELMNMYPDTEDILSKQIQALEQYRNEALSFNFGRNLVGI